MRILDEVKLDFDDVLLVPKRSVAPSRKGVKLSRKYTFLNSQVSWEGFPLIASNFDTTGTFAMASAFASQDALTCLHKHYDFEKLRGFFKMSEGWCRNRVFYTLGIKDDDFIKLNLVASEIDLGMISVDVANGYTKYFVDKVKKVRESFPKAIIMAGNVATPEMVSELLLSGGADIVKIGIGSGSVCTTRVMTGVGYPQFSAVIECADAAHGLRGHICSDGGCCQPQDVVKAFGGGADFVMIGGMLAGTAECEGQWQLDGTRDEVRTLKFYGMSSKEAMEKHSGGVADYKAAEGKCVEVPYKGPAIDVVKEIMGGLRGACTMVGTEDIKDLSKCSTFVKVNRTHNRIFGG